MKKLIFISVFFVIVLSACGSESLSEGDEKACEHYQTTVESSENDDISDEEMLKELEEAWNMAESERLQDLLDDLLIYFEDGEGDLQKNVNAIKTYCSLE